MAGLRQPGDSFELKSELPPPLASRYAPAGHGERHQRLLTGRKTARRIPSSKTPLKTCRALQHHASLRTEKLETKAADISQAYLCVTKKVLVTLNSPSHAAGAPLSKLLSSECLNL